MTPKQPLKISAHSTAMFSTWYFVEQAGLLFDCGDGISAALQQKSRKIKHVFLSHADRDHVAGLLQFNQLNGRQSLRIYYPKDCGTFPHLADFCAKFDPHTSNPKWIPISPGDDIRIRDDLAVRAIENRHVKTENGQVKSLTYIVDRISRKLKPEFAEKNGGEIGLLRKQHGEEYISTISRTTELIYSGDTPIETDGRYNDTEILIHEATFLTANEIEPNNPHRNKHSSLDQVMQVVADSNIQTLILGHFSSRYDPESIDKAIRNCIVDYGITIPVYRILPGDTIRDILTADHVLG